MKKILFQLVLFFAFTTVTFAQFSITPYDVSCTDSCDGYAIVYPAGNYHYTWSNGTHSQDATGLCAGTYSMTVSDSNGQPLDTLVTVITQPAYVVVTIDSIHNATCPNLSDGGIFAHATGGTPPYTFFWPQLNVGDTASSRMNLGPGTFNLIVLDSNYCRNSDLEVVINPGILIDTAIFQQPNCTNPTAGKIRITATGGSTPYFYSWSNGGTADSISNLLPGNYSVTVTDSSGCSAVKNFNLPHSTILVTASHGDASCVNGGVASATVYVAFGSSPHTLLWGTTPPQTTQTASNLSAGTYNITVTDNAGCLAVSSVTIGFTSFNYYVYVHPGFYPNCGTSNGSLIASPLGGSGSYLYQWSNGSTSQTASGLASGNYSVTVTDGGGCTASGNANLAPVCYNMVNGNIFNDLNGNCVSDSGDTHLGGVLVVASKGGVNVYGSSDAFGNYSIPISDTGTFTLSYDAGPCGTLVPCGNPNPTASFTNFQQTVNQNFGFTGVNEFDLRLHPGWTSANPGFQKDYWIYYFNQTQQIFSGAATLVFQYDANLVYQSSAPPLPVHDAVNHTLTWITNGVNTSNGSVTSWSRVGNCHFLVPSSLPSGYHLQSDIRISPTSTDCDSSNNHIHYSELVSSSLDPNEKEVSPAGNITEEDSVLTYTVHFQNTGTDTTWFVIVKDTLNNNLDPMTVQNIASSHAYAEFTISGQGILTWVFNPIYLVDSGTNEATSKGFVSFRVKKKKNLPIGTIISNRAAIVFDYNQPLFTNTVVNTLAEPNYVFALAGDKGVSVTAIPNPFKEVSQIVVNGLTEKFDFALFDVTGRNLKTVNAIEGNRFELNRDALPVGLYFYKISCRGKAVANGKVVIE